MKRYVIFDHTADLGIAVYGADRAELLVNYLRESLHAFNGQGLLLKEQNITLLEDTRLVATFRGEPFDPDRHPMETEIKAVTYYQAEVQQTGTGWVARLVMDV